MRTGIGLVAAALALVAPPALRAQCPDGTPPPCRAAHPAPPPASIAVLYFDNLSPDSTNVYLADGITEEIISRLGQVQRLTIKSRYALRHYRDLIVSRCTCPRPRLTSFSVPPAGVTLRD